MLAGGGGGGVFAAAGAANVDDNASSVCTGVGVEEIGLGGDFFFEPAGFLGDGIGET